MATAPRDGIRILNKLNDCTICDSIQNIAPSPTLCDLHDLKNQSTSNECVDIQNSNNKKESPNEDSDSEDSQVSYVDDFEEAGVSDNSINDDIHNLVTESRNTFCASTTNDVRHNRTFPDPELREIERNNEILMKKILYHNRRPNQYQSKSSGFKLLSSAAINRKRQEAKIARENQILLRKIQSVKSSFQK
ncbi:uncharacterized protein LOC130891218 [Diorhabda carinulata]|uniref:uncharacterized protein LOC130891218 n=1 Tax=Diorhabda carinulata TaxID=1163345 RepID=UPI0025A014E7|nr:uncharacterized protein LOC130891218 [Diorhabda carinulata]